MPVKLAALPASAAGLPRAETLQAAPPVITMAMGAPHAAEALQPDEPRLHAALAAAATVQRQERARTARAAEHARVTRIGTVHVVVQAPTPQPRTAAPAPAQARVPPTPGAARRPAPPFRSPWSSRWRGE